MQRRLTPLALSATVALLGSSLCLAADKARAAAPQSAASQAQASPQKAPTPLVDINSATRAQLKTLPGIGDAEADRIIAARPYPSKAKLVADTVLSNESYQALRGRIIAVQKGTPPKPKP